MFTDDQKIYIEINNAEDCIKFIQNNTEPIVKWCKGIICLYLSVGKCHVVTYTRRSTQFHYQYSNHAAILCRTISINDHGQTFDGSILTIMYIIDIY